MRADSKAAKRNQPLFRKSQIDREVAIHAASADCGCKQGYCLRRADGCSGRELSGDLTKSTATILQCRSDIQGLSSKEKYIYISRKVNAAREAAEAIKMRKDVKDEEEKEKALELPSVRYVFTLDIPGTSQSIKVCRHAFCRAYGISHWMLDTISSNLKKGLSAVDGTNFHDRSKPTYSFEEMKAIAKRNGIEMSTRQMQVSSD
jgi:hypothetical protein